MDGFTKKDLRVPASIRNHPGVRYAVLGDEEGSDFRYFVELHSGWLFTDGSKTGGTGGGFNTAAAFHSAKAKYA